MGDLNQAVEDAHEAYVQTWRDLPPGKRTEILFKVARRLGENVELIARLECQNIGKPISDARDEAGLGARVFEYYAGAVTKFYGQTIPVARGGFDFTLRQSMGVIAAIVPWNFPFPIACWKAAPALAAGNCVVLKPATQSPLTALLLGQLAHEAGLPAGVLQVLPGSGQEIGDALVTHPLVRKNLFHRFHGGRFPDHGAGGARFETGLTRTGRQVTQHRFCRRRFGAGSRRIADERFANTGQDCCARSRVFVERSIFDRFVGFFVAATREIKRRRSRARDDPDWPFGFQPASGNRSRIILGAHARPTAP